MPLIHIDVGYNFIILYTLIHVKWGDGRREIQMLPVTIMMDYIHWIFLHFGKKMCLLDFEKY